MLPVYTDAEGRFDHGVEDFYVGGERTSRPIQRSEHDRAFHPEMIWGISIDSWKSGTLLDLLFEVSPMVKETRYDFGDIEFGGALLEVECTATPDVPASVKCSFTFSSNSNTLNLEISMSEQPATVWLPSERYFYEARLGSHAPIYAALQGAFLAERGMTNRLVLDFESYSMVPLVVEDLEGEPVTEYSVIWEILDEDRSVDYESVSWESHGVTLDQVPVLEGTQTLVIVKCDGYERSDQVVEPPLEEVHVKLLRDRRASSRCVLRVKVPPLPAGVDPDAFNCYLIVDLISNGRRLIRHVGYDVFGDGRKEYHEFQAEGERHAVYIKGGAAYGYPNDIALEPVEVDTPPGQTVTVELPPIAPPPWPHPVDGLDMEIRFDGRPASIRAEFMFPEASRSYRRTIRDGDTRVYPEWPTRMRWYNDRWEDLELLPPDEEHRNPRVCIHKESNVEVRVWLGGRELEEFSVTLSSRSYLETGVESHDGAAFAWIPGDFAWIKAYKNGCLIARQKTELDPDSLNLVQLASDAKPVEVTVDGESSCPWNVYVTQGDRTKYLMEFTSSRVIYSDADALLFRPAAGNSGSEVTLDLTGGGKLSVTLPALEEPEFASCTIAADFESFGEGSLSIRHEVMPGDVENYTYIRNVYEREPTRVYFTSEGIRLDGVERDRPMLISLRVTTDDGVLLFGPACVELTDDHSVVSGEWRPGVYCTWDPDFEFAMDVYREFDVPGCGKVPWPWPNVISPGRHFIRFRSYMDLSYVEEWVTIPEEGPFTPSEVLLKRLREGGMVYR